MVTFVPSFCHKALDDLSKSNMYNLIRQKSKPSVDLTIRHWPRIFVGGAALMTLYKNRGCLPFREVFSFIVNLDKDLSLFESLSIAGLALSFLGLSCLLMGDSFSGAVLLFRYDDKKNQLNHAQRLLTYWKYRSIFTLLDFAPLIYRVYPDFFNYLRNANNELFLQLISEESGYIQDIAITVIANCVFYWGLKTLIKDLKGEPRSWWGGKIEASYLKDEKDIGGK